MVGQGRAARAAFERRLPKNTSDDETAKLYKIAYDESVRTLRDQTETLSNIRQRLVQFLSFVGAATAFLVGAGIRPSEGADNRTELASSFYPLTYWGIGLMLVTLVATIALLCPIFWRLGVTSNARAIIEGSIDPVDPDEDAVEDEAELLHHLALFYSDNGEKNFTVLAWAKWVSFVAIICGVAQLGVWTTLVLVQLDPTM